LGLAATCGGGGLILLASLLQDSNPRRLFINTKQSTDEPYALPWRLGIAHARCCKLGVFAPFSGHGTFSALDQNHGDRQREQDCGDGLHGYGYL
jgi:hypothetical protein